MICHIQCILFLGCYIPSGHVVEAFVGLARTTWCLTMNECWLQGKCLANRMVGIYLSDLYLTGLEIQGNQELVIFVGVIQKSWFRKEDGNVLLPQERCVCSWSVVIQILLSWRRMGVILRNWHLFCVWRFVSIDHELIRCLMLNVSIFHQILVKYKALWQSFFIS